MQALSQLKNLQSLQLVNCLFQRSTFTQSSMPGTYEHVFLHLAQLTKLDMRQWSSNKAQIYTQDLYGLSHLANLQTVRTMYSKRKCYQYTYTDPILHPDILTTLCQLSALHIDQMRSSLLELTQLQVLGVVQPMSPALLQKF